MLAAFAAETVVADLPETRANVAEAEARLAEPRPTSSALRPPGQRGLHPARRRSPEFRTLEHRRCAARRNRNALRARRHQVEQTRVLAPDAGVISRAAPRSTPWYRQAGTVRLIRQNPEMARRSGRRRPGEDPPRPSSRPTGHAGQPRSPVGAHGWRRPWTRRRATASSVDPQGRRPRRCPAGMFARGEFDLGNAPRP